ncbi:hypothetical protein SAMN04488107_2469 [Geodermatophilus saharensis]|uniref:Uncharacterized protein n=1 Tax=Geodermatophilus saharensis TaxID=1137994 RepID=A0A239EBA3_9ACTN|nr:hypothetical protein [Geodermatophilus saharensis]SNS41789.1 hypothetical protein SAMN04488107_2469 [Geodermatophilus saharensis]
MSQAARPPDPQDPRRGMQPRPKRGRAVLLGTFLGLIVLVFAFILLVSQCSADEDDDGASGPTTTVVVEEGAPPAGT